MAEVNYVKCYPLLALCSVFLWATLPVQATSYSFLPLNLPSGADANAISNTGQILGTTDQNLGYIMDGSSLTTFGNPGYQRIDPLAINNLGAIVGSEDYLYGTQGFLRSPNGVFTNIAYPGSDVTFAFGINDQGEIVGQYQTSTGILGFTWINGNITSFSRGAILGINNLGQMVGIDDVLGNSFLLTNGTFQNIAVPGGTGTVASSINDHGDIAGFFDNYTAPGPAEQGFVLTSSGYQSLIYPGAAQTEIDSINNQGDLIGRDILPDESGQLGAVGYFEAIPVPEPATALLIATALLAFGLRNRPALYRRDEILF